MNIFEAIILGIVEGLTEFLPVSSTGHLTLAEGILGLPVDDPSITAFTAVIQIGAIIATLLFFRQDILRLVVGFVRGVASPRQRGEDYRFAWVVIVGSVPIGIVGFALRDVVTGPLRNLWVVAAALVVWSGAMVLAERNASQIRGEDRTRVRDGLTIGLVQCIALVPGVSRSGATISAGLLLGLDRVTATRLSFFLAIPALTAAGLYELPSALQDGVGLLPTLVGTVVSFVVAYATIAWLLKFVAGNSIVWFVPYRIGLGVVMAILLVTGVLSAT